MIIAIDGPAGCGKTTTSKIVASKLGIKYLDTGAMYRCMALAALLSEPAADRDEKLLLSTTSELIGDVDIVFEDNDGSQLVLLDGKDVTTRIREDIISQMASIVSADSSIRLALVEQQRLIARDGDWIVEGRDIGTVVFPSARVKFFLSATPKERTRRRLEQNIALGKGIADYDELYRELVERDTRDSNRADSPLRCADDAIYLDTTKMTQEDVVDQIVRTYERRKQMDNARS